MNTHTENWTMVALSAVWWSAHQVDGTDWYSNTHTHTGFPVKEMRHSHMSNTSWAGYTQDITCTTMCSITTVWDRNTSVSKAQTVVRAFRKRLSFKVPNLKNSGLRNWIPEGSPPEVLRGRAEDHCSASGEQWRKVLIAVMLTAHYILMGVSVFPHSYHYSTFTQ